MIKSLLTLSIICLTSLAACQAKEKSATPISPEQNMRHGWAIFTGPKRTVLGVNDLDSIKRGKSVFQKHCTGCHGIDGKGNGDVAKLFKIRPTNLRALSGQTPNHYLVVQINNGNENMPSWRDVLTSREAWDVTNYIQSMSNEK